MDPASRTYTDIEVPVIQELTIYRNKKYYDPRVWVREGEKTMKARVVQALEDFKATGSL
jgi:fructose/tagatose bisphosphate aldolase